MGRIGRIRKRVELFGNNGMMEIPLWYLFFRKKKYAVFHIDFEYVK